MNAVNTDFMQEKQAQAGMPGRLGREIKAARSVSLRAAWFVWKRGYFRIKGRYNL
jgi:hypothetical protein